MLFFDNNLVDVYARIAESEIRPSQAVIHCCEIGKDLQDSEIVTTLQSLYPKASFVLITHDKSFIYEASIVIRRSRFGVIEVSEPRKQIRGSVSAMLFDFFQMFDFPSIIGRKIRITHLGFREIEWK